MKNVLLYILLISGLVVSCKKGDKGQDGEPGASYYQSDNGSVTATINYEYPNGDDATVPGTYNAYTSVTDNLLYMDTSETNLYPNYSFDIIRYNADDASNFLRISVCGAEYDKTDNFFFAPNTVRFGISRIYKGTSLFAFATMSDIYNYNYFPTYYEGEGMTITNFKLNTSTHRLTFDYEIVASPDDVLSNYNTYNGLSPVMKGKVDVTLIKSPYNLDICPIPQ